MSGEGGGEILRALLTAEAVESRPVFYCLTLNAYNLTAAAFATVNGALQCHADKWFLMTAILPFGTQSPNYEQIDQPETIQIFDLANLNAFNSGNALSPTLPIPGLRISLYNDSLASCMTLPEYTLWQPNSIIGVTWTGRNYVPGEIEFKFLVLAGIEYAMKGS